jgi:hypothetical protein
LPVLEQVSFGELARVQRREDRGLRRRHRQRLSLWKTLEGSKSSWEDELVCFTMSRPGLRKEDRKGQLERAKSAAGAVNLIRCYFRSLNTPRD